MENAKTDNSEKSEKSEVDILKLENEKLKLDNERLKLENKEWWNQCWFDQSKHFEESIKMRKENNILERKLANQVLFWNKLVSQINDLKQTFNNLSMSKTVEN